MYKGLNTTSGSIFKVTILKADGSNSLDKNGNPIGEQTLATNSNPSSKVVSGLTSTDGKIFHLVFKPADKQAVDAEATLKGLYPVEGQTCASADGQYVIQMYKPVKTFAF